MRGVFERESLFSPTAIQRAEMADLSRDRTSHPPQRVFDHPQRLGLLEDRIGLVAGAEVEHTATAEVLAFVPLFLEHDFIRQRRGPR